MMSWIQFITREPKLHLECERGAELGLGPQHCEKPVTDERLPGWISASVSSPPVQTLKNAFHSADLSPQQR